MQMHRDLYGNGTPGLLPRIERYMATGDERELQREKAQRQRHEENQTAIAELSQKAGTKTMWIAAASCAVTVAMLAVAVLTVWVMFKLANHSAVDIHRMFSNAPTVLATDSAIPRVR